MEQVKKLDNVISELESSAGMLDRVNKLTIQCQQMNQEMDSALAKIRIELTATQGEIKKESDNVIARITAMQKQQAEITQQLTCVLGGVKDSIEVEKMSVDAAQYNIQKECSKITGIIEKLPSNLNDKLLPVINNIEENSRQLQQINDAMQDEFRRRTSSVENTVSLMAGENRARFEGMEASISHLQIDIREYINTSNDSQKHNKRLLIAMLIIISLNISELIYMILMRLI